MFVSIILMGVSGSGKTTIGKLLSQRLGDDWLFYDGDDFHPESNKEKMKKGIALEEDDRRKWLESIRHLIVNNKNEKNLIIACSALRRSYRRYLTGEIDDISDTKKKKDYDHHVYFLHLHGSFELIKERIEKRSHHFFNPSLLKSQFDTLEIEKDEENMFTIDIDRSPEEIVNECIDIYNSIK